MKALLVWLLLTTPVWADDIVFCDPTHPLVPNAVTRVERAFDPSTLPSLMNLLIWTAPHTSMTPSQIAYANQLRGQLDALVGVPISYWICTDTNPVDGMLESVREMTLAEKSAIDAPEVAEAQRQAALDQEIITNDLCTATLAEIESRIDAEVATLQTQLDAAPNTASGIKTHLRNQLYPKLGAVFKKLGKCLRAWRR